MHRIHVPNRVPFYRYLAAGSFDKILQITHSNGKSKSDIGLIMTLSLVPVAILIKTIALEFVKKIIITTLLKK